MSLSNIDIAALTPFAVFIAIAAIVWILIDVLSPKKDRTEQRLDDFRDPLNRRKGEGSTGKTSDAMTRLLEKASPALAKPLQPKNAKEAGKLKARLSHGNFRGDSATTIFLGFKFAALMFGLFIGGGLLLFDGAMSKTGLFRLVLIGGGMFYVPDIILWFISRKRKESLFLGLPDALDLIVVCVEAGLGLDQAMKRVAEEMKRSSPVVADEFGLCNLQLQMGRTRSDVLHDLGQRNGVDDLRALAAIIIQADKFGSSIAQALRVQSDSMRTRRKQIAEEKAAKTAVKLIFPLVIFIFPGIFVVLVGPAAITMVREMFPAMNGG